MTNIGPERDIQPETDRTAGFHSEPSSKTLPDIGTLFPDSPVFDADLGPMVRALVSQANIDRLIAHPAFGEAARHTFEVWSPEPDDELAKSRALQDVGLFTAGLWAIQLHAGPWGLTHGSLAAVLSAWGFASRGRVGPTLAYLRFRGMIRPAPSADRRVSRYAPTEALRVQFAYWFRRELGACAIIIPEVGEMLARMDEPGMLDRLVAAYSAIIYGSQRIDPGPPPTLDVFSHRRRGLIILSQIMRAADDDGPFPSVRPVKLALSELGRRSAASRGQVQAVLRAGAEAGFLLPGEDGKTILSPLLLFHISHFLPMYWICLAEAARQAASGEASLGITPI
ncbi:MAG: hypothetical protein JWR84_2845 [Caulobacter sp.]|nr:hypothetical protein [Caulobacter sp.]